MKRYLLAMTTVCAYGAVAVSSVCAQGLDPGPTLKYPSVSSLRVEYLSDKLVRYHIQQGFLNVPIMNGSANVPGIRGLYMRFMYCDMHLGWPNCLNGDAGCKYSAKPDGRKTLAELAWEIYEAGCKNITTVTLPRANHLSHGVCVMYKQGGYGQPWDPERPHLPSCTYSHEGTEWCSLVTPLVELNHGIVSVADVVGHTARGAIKVKCTAKVKVKFQLPGALSDGMAIGRTGHSRVDVGGKPLGSSFELPPGESDLEITSTLSSVPPGAWTASNVLIVEHL